MVKTIQKYGKQNGKQRYALFEDDKLLKTSTSKYMLQKEITEDDKYRKCEYCGKKFIPENLNQKYCSLECSNYSKLEQVEELKRKNIRLIKSGDLIILKPSNDDLGSKELLGHRLKNTAREALYVRKLREELGI